MDDEQEALEAAQHQQQQEERAQRESGEAAARELKSVIRDLAESHNRFHDVTMDFWRQR